MKNKIKMTIILLILLLISIILIYIINNNGKQNNSTDYSKDSKNVDKYMEEIQNNNKLEYENNQNIYYTLMAIITRYLNAVTTGETEHLIDFYDSKYIEKNNITNENILEFVGIPKLENNKDYYKFRATDVYSADLGQITVHFIYGKYYSMETMQEQDLNLMIELDNTNQTFTIFNYDYMKINKFDKLKLGDVLDIQVNKIDNRGNNTFGYIRLTDEDIAQYYYKEFKELLVYNSEEAYKKLDKDYLSLRFKDKDEFNNFVQTKKIEYYTGNLSKYKEYTNNNGEKIYVCTDTKDNYFYFTQTDGVMRYNVMLDSYTIPTQEYIEKYDSSNTQQKVILNIEKIEQALNSGDYRYVYGKLANGFKEKKYNTQEEFENYLKSSIPQKIKFDYKNFSNEGETYIYDVVVKDLLDENAKNINMQIIMQLKEDRDFVMSFNIEEE